MQYEGEIGEKPWTEKKKVEFPIAYRR